MGLYGTLKTIAMTDILGWMAMGRKEGILTLNSESETKKLYLSGGNLVYASSNLFSEQLANALIQKGGLNREIATELLAEALLTDRELATRLLDKGQITAPNLGACVNSLVEGIFYSLFAWNAGVFLFVDGEIPYRDIWPCSFGLTNMIMEGARQADELIRSKERMDKHRQAHFKIPKDKRKQLQTVVSGRGPRAVSVANLLQEARTLEDIVLLSPESELITLQTIDKLIEEKVVVPVPRAESLENSEERLADLVSRAEIFSSQGRVADAVLCWEVVLSLQPKHEVRGRMEAVKKRHHEALLKRLGPASLVPRIRMEVGSAEPKDLNIPSYCTMLYQSIDGKKDLTVLGKELNMPMEDLYISLNRLSEMNYVHLMPKVAQPDPSLRRK